MQSGHDVRHHPGFFFLFIYKPNIKYSKNKMSFLKNLIAILVPDHNINASAIIRSKATLNININVLSHIGMYDVIFLTTKKMNLIHICVKYIITICFENIGTWDTSPGNLRPSII